MVTDADLQSFGGDWTAEKLSRVRKYLGAYVKIMSKRRFRYAYIDAFAGTGYRTQKQSELESEPMFPELFDSESQKFIEGSATIALEVEPRFSKYIFIEKDPERAAELEKLKVEFPDKASDIIIQNTEANQALIEICQKNWKKHRAVLFLDPYGMQVSWDTIVAIAKTEAIDLWILFPLGVAVNRLLKKDGKIQDAMKNRLNQIFGADDWFDAFYQVKKQPDLFGNEVLKLEKTANFQAIGEYFNQRLKTIFAGVADNPLPLRNSRNNPLYLLCFAAANKSGAPTAIRIAQDILKR